MNNSLTANSLRTALKGIFQSHTQNLSPTLSARALAEQYGEVVFAYTFRRIGHREGAEDVSAECFIAAFQNLRSCPPRPTDSTNNLISHDPIRAWLLGIARRKLADYWRKRKRHSEVSWEGIPERVSSDCTPEQIALRAETQAKIRETLDRLNPDYREALLLRYADGCSVSEVALILGRSVSATDSLLQRARAAARIASGDYFSEFE
jgi:RNA polymerase sigma-70 factor (ECF subfamily)